MIIPISQTRYDLLMIILLISYTLGFLMIETREKIRENKVKGKFNALPGSA